VRKDKKKNILNFFIHLLSSALKITFIAIATTAKTLNVLGINFEYIRVTKWQQSF
jgi:hypothetical protein